MCECCLLCVCANVEIVIESLVENQQQREGEAARAPVRELARGRWLHHRNAAVATECSHMCRGHAAKSKCEALASETQMPLEVSFEVLEALLDRVEVG